MATKEEITARLKAIDAERKTLKAESKDAASETTIAVGKLATYISKSKALYKLLMSVGAPVTIADEDGTFKVTTRGSGAGGTKSPSRCRAANVETFLVDGKDIESAMPSKVIKAIGADYGADSPERWLDKNLAKVTAAKVTAVVDGKRIPIAAFVKAHPAI